MIAAWFEMNSDRAKQRRPKHFWSASLPRVRFLALCVSNILLVACAMVGISCGPAHESSITPGDSPADPAGTGISLGREIFQDVTVSSGLSFAYRNGAEANHYTILESVGGGVALLDYDGDGLIDIFVTGGGYFAGADGKEIRGHSNRLYRNLGGWRFKDVTREAGLETTPFYSHGCAVADYDRDGWPDLLVTGWGRLALYHNESDGRGGRRFVDVTSPSGLPDGLWTNSAAFGDLDGDGYPDLYLSQYVDWSWQNHPRCTGFNSSVPQEICPPQSFGGLAHKLYRNNADGTFTDVSRQAGLRPYTGDPISDRAVGKGLGVLIVDVDNDGKPDVYAANDGVDNFLYMNRTSSGPITLKEEGLLRGASRDDRGVAAGSMGVDAADYDASGFASLWVVNYENQWHSLYRNRGAGQFIHNTLAAGIGAIGQRYVGFGTAFLDLDNDGWEDLVVVNGHVLRSPGYAPVQERPVLLHNLGDGHFADMTAQGGSYFRTDHIGRGLAIGDLDNDGWPDLVVSHLNEPVTLLRHQRGQGHWIGIDLRGARHRDIAGTRVVVDAGGRRLTRFVKGGGSYCSSSDRRLIFGLNELDHVDHVQVFWSWGGKQDWSGQSFVADRYWRLFEGQSRVESSAQGPSKDSS